MVVEQDDSEGEFCLLLRPDVALRWRQTLGVYALIALTCLGVALGFALRGFWPILGFAGLEVLALGAGLYVSALRVLEREVVRIGTAEVTIEKGRYRPLQSWRFERCWTEVAYVAPTHRWYPSRLFLRSRGSAVELGGFLQEKERAWVARELRRRIGSMTTPGTGV